MGSESIMSPKAHGTSAVAVQSDLRWGCPSALASNICNYNRHYAEHSGFFSSSKTTFLKDFADATPTAEKPTTFYDSNSGLPLFVAPVGRSPAAFLSESESHGWPSFRDSEVVWENVRVLEDGETVSVGGTHLGHNLPDKKGNRYCINLVSVAGKPAGKEGEGL